MARSQSGVRMVNNSAEEAESVEFVQFFPQVHIHTFTSKEEAKRQGYYLIELCCHGCHTAMLVKSDSANHNVFSEIRDAFLSNHKSCRNYGYEDWCFDYRKDVSEFDARGWAEKPRRKSGTEEKAKVGLLR